MSMEQTVCNLVKKHWNNLYPNGQPPDSFVFLKIAGKTSPNAAIIAMILDADYRQPVAVAKIPRNPEFTKGIEREYEAMADIRNVIKDSRILEHTPCRGVLTENDGINILLQAAGVGHPMVREMTSRESVKALYEKILPWMYAFHSNGAEQCVLEGDILKHFVETPIERFIAQFGQVSPNILSNETRQFLSELPKRIKGRAVRLCRQHGDFNAHNILVETRGHRLKNFMLIDWEDYRPRQLPVHDLNHFFTSNSHLLGNGMPPKESYAKLLLNDGWYRKLYLKAVAEYESYHLIDLHTFLTLSPLYMISMCFCIADAQRSQQYTVSTWINRMNTFIRSYMSTAL